MEDVKKRIGQKIRDARKAKGLTLKELGEKVGVSESVVGRYETGKQNLTIETLQKVADALGVSFNASLE